jgi:hypothetical protein
MRRGILGLLVLVLVCVGAVVVLALPAASRPSRAGRGEGAGRDEDAGPDEGAERAGRNEGTDDAS